MRTPWLIGATLLASAVATAQPKNASDGIAEYRAMLADGNPAELFEAKGEALWKQPRGPKAATLEACDLGLVTCMQTLQGFDAQQIVQTPFGKGEMVTLEALAAWISGQSRGMRFDLPQARAEERLAYELGKRAFFFRAGPYDFACASCHGTSGQRIRLQDLPELTKNPGDGIGFAAWPAYRVSSGEMWSMQHRLNDCFRQQRFPFPGYGSQVTVALGVYMGVNARGAASVAPALKR